MTYTRPILSIKLNCYTLSKSISFILIKLKPQCIMRCTICYCCWRFSSESLPTTCTTWSLMPFSITSICFYSKSGCSCCCLKFRQFSYINTRCITCDINCINFFNWCYFITTTSISCIISILDIWSIWCLRRENSSCYKTS